MTDAETRNETQNREVWTTNEREHEGVAVPLPHPHRSDIFLARASLLEERVPYEVLRKQLLD